MTWVSPGKWYVYVCVRASSVFKRAVTMKLPEGTTSTIQLGEWLNQLGCKFDFDIDEKYNY